MVGRRAARLCVPAVGEHSRVSWRQGKNTLRTSEYAQLGKFSAVQTKKSKRHSEERFSNLREAFKKEMQQMSESTKRLTTKGTKTQYL